MVKNRHLSKAIADVNFGELRRQLEYKCNNVVVVPRFFASSKICSKCGYIYNPTDFDNVKWNLGSGHVFHTAIYYMTGTSMQPST